MSILDRIDALSLRTGYRPPWFVGNIPSAVIAFDFVPIESESRDIIAPLHKIDSVKEPETYAAKAAEVMPVFFRSFVRGVTIDGEEMGQDAAVAALVKYTTAGTEVTLAASRAASVSEVEPVADMLQAAEIREADVPGSGMRWLAERLFSALGGIHSEGND